MTEFVNIMAGLEAHPPRTVANMLAMAFLDNDSLVRFQVEIFPERQLMQLSLAFTSPWRSFDVDYEPLMGFRLYRTAYHASGDKHRLEPGRTFPNIEDLIRRIRSSKHRPSCQTCGREGSHNDVYDAYYCPACVCWLEGTCGQNSCGFCNLRPEKPPVVAEAV